MSVDRWKIWWRAFRFHYSSASFMPGILGTMIAWTTDGEFHAGYFLLVMLGLSLAISPWPGPSLRAALPRAGAAQCHGDDLAGTDRGPSLLEPIYGPDQLSDAEVADAIRNGVDEELWEFGPMPANGAISDAQIERAFRMPFAIDAKNTSFSRVTNTESLPRLPVHAHFAVPTISPPPLTPRDLLRPRGRRVADGIAPAATFPGLAPVPAGAGPADEPLGDEAYTALLRAAEHRDEVGDLLLQRALASIDRCCLLALHSGKIVGWLGRGAGVVLDDLESFAIEAEDPSVLAGLAGGGTFCGPLPSGLANQLLVEVLGDPMPTEVAIVPVPVKNRVVAFLIGDLPGAALPPGTVEELQNAAQKAGVALEILVMRRKFLA